MPGGRQSRKWEQGIAALLETRTLAEAADKAGVALRTIKGWLEDPDFQAAFRDARRQVVEHAIARLQKSASAAAGTLRRNLRAEKEAVQVRAASEILKHAVGAVELGDVLARLKALEAKMEGTRK